MTMNKHQHQRRAKAIIDLTLTMVERPTYHKEMKKVADFSDLSINKRLDYVTETHNINSLSI